MISGPLTANDSSKSFRFIASDIGVSELLIEQVLHENIRYFAYKMRKGQFLISGHEGQEERLRCRTLEQNKTFPSTEHALNILRENFLSGS